VKPSSVISLIIAVLLIIVGLTTCIIAQNMANANGETLFSEVKSDGLENTIELTDLDISKIELIVSDAEINVYGKSDKSYIKFVNFRENYYTLTTANKVLSFDEIPDVVSMLKFWENGFSFKGMRYIFNFQPETEGKKVIDIYLSRDLDIKIFNITAENGVVNLMNLTTDSDYNINVTAGEINAKTLKTTSSFKITGTDLKVAMTSTILNNTEIKADNLDLNITSFRTTGSTSIEAKTGNVELVTPYSTDSLTLDLDTVDGAITINGKAAAAPHKQTNPESPDTKISIITESADISIRHNSFQTEPAEPEETTPPEA